MSDQPVRPREPLPPLEVHLCGHVSGCRRPATVHIYWAETNAASPACDGHARLAVVNPSEEIDTHTFQGACGIPGTHWHIPTEDEIEGWCYVDGLSVEVQQAVKAGAR